MKKLKEPGEKKAVQYRVCSHLLYGCYDIHECWMSEYNSQQQEIHPSTLLSVDRGIYGFVLLCPLCVYGQLKGPHLLKLPMQQCNFHVFFANVCNTLVPSSGNALALQDLHACYRSMAPQKAHFLHKPHPLQAPIQLYNQSLQSLLPYALGVSDPLTSSSMQSP